MEIKDILEKLNTLQPNNSSYILFQLEDVTDIYYGINENRDIIFVLESSSPQIRPNSQITKELRFDFNCNAELIINEKKINKFIHMFTCLSKDYSNIEAFIRLSKAFVINRDIKDIYYLNKLFNAFVSLFTKETKPSENEIQGLFAELFVVTYFEEKEINLYQYWQSKDRMKFDFSISDKKRLEIKSTSREIRIHHFLHEQLLTDFYDIKVISVIMRRSDKGISLFDLIKKIRNSKYVTYNILLHIEKLIKQLSEQDLINYIYDDILIKSKMKIFSACDIPHFNEKQPNGVFNTEYDCDLSNIEEIETSDFINWLKN